MIKTGLLHETMCSSPVFAYTQMKKGFRNAHRRF